jgi:hypothetical protein
MTAADNAPRDGASRPRSGIWLAVGAPLAALAVMPFCALPFVLEYSGGALGFGPDTAEVLPLPAPLQVLSYNTYCVDLFSCVVDVDVTSTDGVPPAVTKERLATHLVREGWPVAGDGCRRVGGFLSWHRHCVGLDVERDHVVVSVGGF